VDSYFGSIVLEVYKTYAGKMRKENALDFDDLLLCFRQILDIAEVREYFHNRFQYFMVDEYQDTNTLQYETIRILASHSKNLCVVGDDWQGIYSWRGADISNILNFKRDYPNAKVINLEENYRSTKVIIEAANAVIKNNTNQMQKTLFTSNPTGEKIILLDGLDEKHEAEMIAGRIKEGVSENSEQNPPNPLSQGGTNPFRPVEEVIPTPTGDISLAGRVMLHRSFGKICFATIHDGTGRMQVLFSRENCSISVNNETKTELTGETEPVSAYKFAEKLIDL
jgi:DNA helicase-2/ATP-dependent DNA helicase PcrA